LGRHHGLVVNGKRALRVMRERGLGLDEPGTSIVRGLEFCSISIPGQKEMCLVAEQFSASGSAQA
jgi:hypothetical protein